MSIHSRYEEMDQQFNDLPMPDEETSWQKMKELLDEDDDKEIIPPPVFFRSCLGWGLLFASLIAAWLVIRPDNRWSKDSKARHTSSSNKIPDKKLTGTNPTEKPNPASEKSDRASQPLLKKHASIIVVPQKTGILLPSQSLAKKNSTFNPVSQKNEQKSLQKRKTSSQNEILFQQPPTESKRDETIAHGDKSTKADTSSSELDQSRISIVNDTAKKDNSTQAGDSVIQKKTQPSPKRKFFLIAGIGEQQQIPIAGQTAVPYSHYGRKGSLSDYVPSVFLCLQREQKWFVQGEFRYGAAQSVKEFSYNRQTSYDAASKNVTTTTMWLKKTYYHQLPLSFNYYVRPYLSVGIGGMYSHFYGAITEQDTKIENLSSGTQTVFRQIIPVRHFTDSFLYKTQVHILVQADYQWKRFSFGLRYAKDIQPFIKYTRPDGTVDEEKNQSLQLMIRFRLWKKNS